MRKREKYLRAIVLLAAAAGQCGLAQTQAAPPNTPQFTTLWGFGGTGDGHGPIGPLAVDSNGAVYGATEGAGPAGEGIVFQLVPPAAAGDAWTENIIFAFNGGSNGCCPHGGVAFGPDGLLYGTSPFGGPGGPFGGSGTVFQLTPPSAGGSAWTETLLHTFTDGSDGGDPEAGVVFGAGGILYGTTSQGGTGSCTSGTGVIVGCGTVYQLTPPSVAGDVWTHTILYNFAGGTDGAEPRAIVLGANGALYGTTFQGGGSAAGTVFELSPPAVSGGPWTESVLHSFKNVNGFTFGSVVLGKNGALFGVALGGKSKGYVFQLRPPAAAGGAWTLRELHQFGKTANDGRTPQGNLVYQGGALYGATSYGGGTGCGGFGCGTIFKLKPPSAPGGTWTEHIVHVFTGAAGGQFATSVTFANGALYGDATEGGTNGQGIVYQLIP
jgi:uncharacterized repeat protein (TIGR03803 family)